MKKAMKKVIRFNINHPKIRMSKTREELLKYIPTEGKYIITFYWNECPHCVELVNHLLDLSENGLLGNIPIIVVDIDCTLNKPSYNKYLWQSFDHKYNKKEYGVPVTLIGNRNEDCISGRFFIGFNELRFQRFITDALNVNDHNYICEINKDQYYFNTYPIIDIPHDMNGIVDIALFKTIPPKKMISDWKCSPNFVKYLMSKSKSISTQDSHKELRKLLKKN